MPDTTDYMQDWRAQRCRDILYDFGTILPIYSESAKAFTRSALQMNLSEIVPAFMTDLARVLVNHEKESLSYIIWLRDACNHIIDQNAPAPITVESYPEDQHAH